MKMKGIKSDDLSKVSSKAEKKNDNKPSAKDELIVDSNDTSEEKSVDMNDKPLEKEKEVNTDSDDDAPLKKPNSSDKKVNGHELSTEWVCGDLVWALISGHPFWPGIIITDPALGEFKKTKKGRGESVIHDFHVQFFGDKGSHCWVTAGRILKYFGEAGLRSFAESKKKEKKYSSALPDGKGASSLKWKCAVKEADDAVAQSRKERIEYFEEYYPLKKPKQSIQAMKKEKGSNSVLPVETPVEKVELESVPSRKRGRTDPIKTDEENESSDSEVNDKKEKEPKTDENTGSRTRSKKIQKEKESDSDEDFAIEDKKKKKRNLTVKTQKKRYKKKEKLQPGNFEIFFEKSAPHCSELNSRFADDEEALRRYLMKMWETMNEDEKSKYAEYPVTCT